jgi:hypothetical protein
VFRCCALLAALLAALPASAQPARPDGPGGSGQPSRSGAIGSAVRSSPEQAPSPAIRRWIDLQHVHLASRFRWVKSNDGRLTSSTHQWQPQVRARVLFDTHARYTLHVGAFGGSHFVSGWNNTGGGVGDFSGDFNIKQLFVAAEPVSGFEVQAGGLYMTRGENTEITSYDTDAYIVGERVTVRRREGPLAQVAATVGYIGDYRTPNVFDRLRRMNEFNYGQLLVGARVGSRVGVSADYTYEDGRDILRQGLTARPRQTPLLTSVRVEAYQRVSPDPGQGFNVAGELRLASRFMVTLGVTHIDRNYLAPGYMSLNADRYERGTRFYSQGTYTLTRDLSVGWFHGQAFATRYTIPNQHRFEAIVTFNPTATLKRKGVF